MDDAVADETASSVDQLERAGDVEAAVAGVRDGDRVDYEVLPTRIAGPIPMYAPAPAEVL